VPTAAVQADIVVLKSGKQIKGEVLVKNSEVVIIRNESGARFQFPAGEVTEIRAEEREEVPQSEKTEVKKEAETKEKDNTAEKKTAESKPAEGKVTEKAVRQQQKHPVALRIMLSGGASCLSNGKTGGMAEAEFRIGSRDLANRRIFVGGSVGWHGTFFAAQTDDLLIEEGELRASVAGPRHYIPLQAVVSVPLMQGKHAPEIGATLGYGFCSNSRQSGVSNMGASGLTGGVELSWRCQVNAKTAFLLGWQTHFQQTTCTMTEAVDGGVYSRSARCTLINTGMILSLQF
jgi:hypothetical protein